MILVFWSEEDEGYIAIDPSRPGCSAFADSEDEALRGLEDARRAWDQARRAALAAEEGR